MVLCFHRKRVDEGIRRLNRSNSQHELQGPEGGKHGVHN